MSIIVAVSGAQGCGKSSVLSALEQQGYSVSTLKASRTIQKEMGLTLDEITSNEYLTMEMQERILTLKVEHDSHLFTTSNPKDGLIFTERSIADLAAYAMAWDTQSLEYKRWLKDYINRCMDAQSDIYDVVTMIPSGIFSMEQDPHRGPAYNQQLVGELLDNLVHNSTKNIVYIESVSIADRCVELLNKIRNKVYG